MALEDKGNVAHGLLKELSNSLFPTQQKYRLTHCQQQALTNTVQNKVMSAARLEVTEDPVDLLK